MNNLDNAAAKAFGWDAERLKGNLRRGIKKYLELQEQELYAWLEKGPSDEFDSGYDGCKLLAKRILHLLEKDLYT